MRPHDDLRDHDEVPDPQETIHFLRQSNEQWQAAAERIARQRDRYYEAVQDIDRMLCSLDPTPEAADAIDAIAEIVERATLGIAT